METRDRATGWQYAKLSGHKNEELVKEAICNCDEFRNAFLKRVNKVSGEVIKCSIGGLHETTVPSVYGKKTKSKTDLKVYLDSDEVINVSIKKSLSGQVYFVRAGLFIETFEKQFGVDIPMNVKRAIDLFWAEADDSVEIIENFGDRRDIKDYNLQIRHKSLNAATLKTYDVSLYEILLEWFADNAYEIAKLSFSVGAVRDRTEWSDFVWYINLLGENDIDDIFFVEDICTAVQEVADRETY